MVGHFYINSNRLCKKKKMFQKLIVASSPSPINPILIPGLRSAIESDMNGKDDATDEYSGERIGEYSGESTDEFSG